MSLHPLPRSRLTRPLISFFPRGENGRHTPLMGTPSLTAKCSTATETVPPPEYDGARACRAAQQEVRGQAGSSPQKSSRALLWREHAYGEPHSSDTMSYPSGSRYRPFRTIFDRRSHTTEPRAFRTDPEVPFKDFERLQKCLSEQSTYLQSAAEKYYKRRKNRNPKQQAADKETHRKLSEASAAVQNVLVRLSTTFPDQSAWSEADKADMHSSVEPVKEGFITTFQASRKANLGWLLKLVKELVQAPSAERSDKVVRVALQPNSYMHTDSYMSHIC